MKIRELLIFGGAAALSASVVLYSYLGAGATAPPPAHPAAAASVRAPPSYADALAGQLTQRWAGDLAMWNAGERRCAPNCTVPKTTQQAWGALQVQIAQHLYEIDMTEFNKLDAATRSRAPRMRIPDHSKPYH